MARHTCQNHPWGSTPGQESAQTAWLHELRAEVREGAKQETPEFWSSKVSTTPTPVAADGRAASAHHDRGR